MAVCVRIRFAILKSLDEAAANSAFAHSPAHPLDSWQGIRSDPEMYIFTEYWLFFGIFASFALRQAIYTNVRAKFSLSYFFILRTKSAAAGSFIRSRNSAKLRGAVASANSLSSAMLESIFKVFDTDD